MSDLDEAQRRLDLAQAEYDRLAACMSACRVQLDSTWAAVSALKQRGVFKTGVESYNLAFACQQAAGALGSAASRLQRVRDGLERERMILELERAAESEAVYPNE